MKVTMEFQCANHVVFEPDSLGEKLNEPEVMVGDTIEYASCNQLGYTIYRVIERDGKKTVRAIADIDGLIDDGDET